MHLDTCGSNMRIDRKQLYRFPWSQTDNCGGWVEVTDECDLTCKGCYRNRLFGHRSLDEVKRDILECQQITNCDAMAIAGGEPLVYPQIVDVVDFISRRNMKPVILTNGEKLTRDFASELKEAGLAKFHFHIDSGQERRGWTGKNEVELNSLRQHFADLVWDLGGMQCGYNVTVYRATLKHVPAIVEWCRANVHKVQHISLIAFRAIPLIDDIRILIGDKFIDLSNLYNVSDNVEETTITSEEMFGILQEKFSDLRPCAYLGGTTSPETHKYLVSVHVGSKNRIYGVLGPKTVELVQTFYHFMFSRYCSFLRSPKAGKKLFLLSLFDREVRRAFRRYLKESLKNPLRLFESVYTQTIHLQQPNEVYDGDVNLCDGCANMMVYQGQLINSCRLDEYRMFGRPVTVISVKGSQKSPD